MYYCTCKPYGGENATLGSLARAGGSNCSHRNPDKSHVKGGDPQCQESCESCHLKALAGDEGGSYNTPCGGSRDPDQHVAKEAKGNKKILELGSLSRQKVWGRGSGDGSVTYPSPQ